MWKAKEEYKKSEPKEKSTMESEESTSSTEEKKYNSLFLNLKVNDPKEEEMYEFLMSVGNKRSQLIIHALEEFIDKYHLSGASKKMVHLFLSEYAPDERTVVSRNNKRKANKDKKTEEDSFNDNVLDTSMLKRAKEQLKMFG